MRSTLDSLAAPLLLGSTLVYAAYIHPDAVQANDVLRKRQDTQGWGELGVASGTITLPTIHPNAATSSQASTTDSILPNAAVAATVDSQSHDSVTDHATNTIHTSSGTLSGFSIYTHPASTSAASIPSSLAPSPSTGESTGIQNRGVLVGVVVGGVVFGCLALTVGLWLCYRRRGPTSGTSTPRYTTPVVDDEKRSRFAFMRGGTLPWKKGHVRVKSSMSFASPVIGDEPKMIETPSASSRAPLASHTGGNAGRDTWNGRWSTFSTSDGSAYPQTPVNNTLPLSGVLMETVVESDAPSTPRAAPGPLRTPSDYLHLQRSSNDSVFAIPPAKDQSPHLPPLGATRYSTYREEDTGTLQTPTSSTGLTFGSVGHGGNAAHNLRMSDRTVASQPFSSSLYSTNNGSYVHQGNNSTALLATRPKFNPTIHHNGSGGSVSTRQGSTGSGGDGATIKITNPFLDDDEDLSSYGHGIVEAASDIDDSRSIQSMESGVSGFAAYPSSAGCMPPPSNLKHGALSPSPSPRPDTASSSTASAPMTRPRSSLISDASSDYPYPMGYTVDPDGNVANPFLRISELLEEVDGRMRWPSPPLLSRSDSTNY